MLNAFLVISKELKSEFCEKADPPSYLTLTFSPFRLIGLVIISKTSATGMTERLSTSFKLLEGTDSKCKSAGIF